MTAEFNSIKNSLVDKILTQGQRLRNAMVQSILENDPLYANVISNKTYNTPMSSASSLANKSKEDKKLLEAFLSGDYLTKDQEEIALNTVRSMPPSDVCETTQKTRLSKCSCATCAAYYMNNLKCDLRRTVNCNRHLSSQIKPENSLDCARILEQVDSLKVILQSIHLNNLGNKKVTQGLIKGQLNSGLNETYFVEYYIPEIFTKQVLRSRSKTDSGLEDKHVRVCARRTSNVIHLRQIFIHSICNLYNCNLEDHDIIFTIRYKSPGLRKSEALGIAKFNLGLFKNAKNASCGKTLPILLHEESPITVGTLKVTLQLGVEKLYFGREFLDAVLHPRNSESANSSEENLEVPNYDTKLPVDKVEHDRGLIKAIKSDKPQTCTTVIQPEVPHSAPFQQYKSYTVKSQPVDSKDSVDSKNHQGQSPKREFEGDILFGFLYISEAQFLNVSPNSFILCQPYCQNDTSVSRVVHNSSNPLYNFCQTIPLFYEEDLLLKLRENFMLIEFWEKSGQTDELFGLTRLPLHQFYLGYRNTIILKHLKSNKLPIIGTDWWEPIYSTDNNELIGQVQVLTALGTEDQIKNLELERGFKDDIVKAKFPKATQTKKDTGRKQPSTYFVDRVRVNKNSLKPVNHKALSNVNHVMTETPQKFDVGVQSDIETQMDLKDNSPKPLQTQDMLSSFLKLLEKTQRPPCVENSTNTESTLGFGASSQVPKADSSRAPQLGKTSDLLDSLQKALTLDSVQTKKVEKPPSFKAKININGANQLPSRRKIKSKTKRSKGKHAKQEDNILPSTYVTFETMPAEPLQITSVCSKSTSPQWNYQCEVSLPMDLLTNGQKRLIFKVWKKCTNAVLQPNMQTDLVLGFAALDLSVLSVGLPSVQGWFNIIDFSGKCNGQINIHIIPLEKVKKIHHKVEMTGTLSSDPSVSNQMPENEECNELLSRALKRKFTELDEITQRLRLRLSEVVSEDSEGSNDDMTDEFEHDINNLCVEDDFDLINFEEEARKFSINQSKKSEQKDKSNVLSSKSEPGTSLSTQEEDNLIPSIDQLKSASSGLLAEKQGSSTVSGSSTGTSLLADKNIAEGKHRIDTLLEKLSLITAEASQPFSSRYVSGCSAASNDLNDVQDILKISDDTGDVQDILKHLEQHSRPNITAANSFDPVLFQQLYGGSMTNMSSQNSKPSDTNSTNPVSGSSETSVISNFSDCRPNPDGEGTSDGKGT